MINGLGGKALGLGGAEVGKSSETVRRVMVTPVAIPLTSKNYDRIILFYYAFFP